MQPSIPRDRIDALGGRGAVLVNLLGFGRAHPRTPLANRFAVARPWLIRVAVVFLRLLHRGIHHRSVFARTDLLDILVLGEAAIDQCFFRRLTIPVLVFLLALVLYFLTLAPDLLTADNAEYQLVAHHLGVAHPPGYALYTMLGKLFTLLPINTPAWRVNLFAAVTGALALAALARTVQRLTGSAWGGVAAALALGVAPTFWAQSTTANIRSLTVLFTVWCFDALVAFGNARQRGESGQRALHWFALGLGLGLGHHLSLGMLLPAFGLYLLVADPSLARRPRRWFLPGLIFLSTFLVLVYIPIRGSMGAVLAPEHLTTMDGFLEHVLAR